GDVQVVREGAQRGLVIDHDAKTRTRFQPRDLRAPFACVVEQIDEARLEPRRLQRRCEVFARDDGCGGALSFDVQIQLLADERAVIAFARLVIFVGDTWYSNARTLRVGVSSATLYVSFRLGLSNLLTAVDAASSRFNFSRRTP